MEDRETSAGSPEGAMKAEETPVQAGKSGAKDGAWEEGTRADMARDDAAEREEALERREKEVMRRELRAGAMEKLAEKGLPGALAELLDYRDADACSHSLDAAEKAFRGAVQAGITERLKGAAPRTGADIPAPGKDTYGERARLYSQDRQRYQAVYGL
jgi:hypothetical protein